MHTNAALYDQDFYAWTQTTAALLREGKWYDLDLAAYPWTPAQVLAADFWPEGEPRL